MGDFFAFDANQQGGVNVGTDSMAGDVDGDSVPDLVVGSGAGIESRVKVYSGKSGAVIRDFAPFDAGMTSGVRVATAFVDDDGFADIVVGTGPGVAGTIRVFSGETGSILSTPVGEFSPFGANALGGVNLAATNDPPGGTLLADDTQNWVENGYTVAVSVQVYGNDPAAPGKLHWLYNVSNLSFDNIHDIGWFGLATPVWQGVTNMASSIGWTPSLSGGALPMGISWAGGGEFGPNITSAESATFTFDTPMLC